MTSASRSALSTRSVTSSRLPMGGGQTPSRPLMGPSSRPPTMRRPLLIAAALLLTVGGGATAPGGAAGERPTTAGATAPGGAAGEKPAAGPESAHRQAAQTAPGPNPYDAALHAPRTIGPRPSAGAGELRVHRYAAAQFRAAGLPVAFERFGVPGRGRSRDVVGVLDTPADRLTILMAHADSFPGMPGANDNASGVGVIVALARRLAKAPTTPPCDVWLVVTGSHERGVTGRDRHLR